MNTRLSFITVLLLGLTMGGSCPNDPAGFLAPQFTISGVVVGQGRIEIVKSEGNELLTNAAFAQGSEVALVAIPAEGWLFVRWESGASGTEAQITLTVDTDKSVSAVFVAVAGVRTINVNGVLGRMTLAVRGIEVRGNRRTNDFAADLQGILTGTQLSLTSSSPGFSDATISAAVQSTGSLSGTINGSGFTNSPFNGDPVSLVALDEHLSGQRTTTISSTGFPPSNGVLTVAVANGNLQGTWRAFDSFGGDVDGTATETSVSFTLTIPGLNPAIVNASIQADGSWVGTITGSGFNNDPFTANPSFFP